MNKIKLNKLEDNDLSKREMNQIVGGERCGCACAYAGQPGGSSTNDNATANAANNLVSVGYRIDDCDMIIIDGEVW